VCCARINMCAVVRLHDNARKLHVRVRSSLAGCGTAATLASAASKSRRAVSSSLARAALIDGSTVLTVWAWAGKTAATATTSHMHAAY
jgi:hypothetical protein